MEVKSIEGLFLSNGKLNSAIIRRDWFLQSELHKDIIGRSSSLDVFPDVEFGHRVWFIKDNMEVGSCPVCGKPFLVMPKGHGNHTFTLCDCKKNYTLDSKKRLIEGRALTKSHLLETILHSCSLNMTDKDFALLLDEMNHRPANYQFMPSEKYKDFYSDLVFRTRDILPNNSLDIPQRLYIVSNQLDALPTCSCCGKELKFKNRFVGYAPCSCTKHERSQETRAKTYSAKIPSIIDQGKYEILKYPTRLSDGLVIRCRKCGEVTTIRMTCGRLNELNHNSLLCKHCESFNGTSRTEKDIVEFIRSVCPSEDIIENDRSVLSPKELDVYIPGQNLAFEYDGLYWHRESWHPNRNSHLDKTNGCERQGIHLIHIFENEWMEKQDIVKSRIRNLLGSYDKVVYARNCEVKEVPSKLASEFQCRNHIQGGVRSKVNLGLWKDGELVSLMTFSKPRFSKKYEWELVRFCNKLNHHVIGGASKLMAHFERTYHPKSMVSYADRRWSMDSDRVLYRKLGFSLKSISQPNYWYVKGGEVFNRVMFQKHKLNGLLDKFDESKSEWQNMQDNGYDRIFDCGNLVFVKGFNS